MFKRGEGQGKFKATHNRIWRAKTAGEPDWGNCLRFGRRHTSSKACVHKIIDYRLPHSGSDVQRFEGWGLFKLRHFQKRIRADGGRRPGIQRLLNGNDDHLGRAADPHGRTPGAGPAAGVDGKVTHLVEAIIESLIDQGGEDLQGPHLSVMGMTG